MQNVCFDLLHMSKRWSEGDNKRKSLHHASVPSPSDARCEENVIMHTRLSILSIRSSVFPVYFQHINTCLELYTTLFSPVYTLCDLIPSYLMQ